MTNRYGGIAILFLHHQLSHRLTNDVGTSEDDTLLAAGLDVITLQKRDDAKGRGRDEARQTNRHTTYVDGMEAIDILTIVDRLNNLLLIDMLWQRQLHDEAINIVVLVQLIDTGQQFCLRDVSLKTNER